MKFFVFLLNVILMCSFAQGNTVAVKWNNAQQEIDGFGAAVAAGSCRLLNNQTWIDMLFKTDNGIGLSIFRMKVPSSINPDPAPNELSELQEALKRNPSLTVIACPWSPPAEWKDNNSTVAGHLLVANYGNYANSLAEFALKMKNLGINLHALSVQNEPDAIVNYASCFWNGSQYLSFTRDYLKPAFVSKNISAKIMMGEWGEWKEDIVLPTLNDPSGVNAIDIVSGHGYNQTCYPVFSTALSKGKKVWMTEECNTGPGGSQINDGLYWAERIFIFMNDNSASAWLYWLFASTVNGAGILTGDGINSNIVNRRYYTVGNYSKFVRPGYYRIETTPARHVDALVSAYKDPQTGAFAIVAINKNSTAVSMTFNLDFAAGSVVPYLTTQTDNLAAQPAIPVVNGTFTTTLAASSVTTFTGVLDPAAVFGPQVEPSTGYFFPHTSVVMKCATPGAQIYYTTDESEPTQSSKLYSGPFTLEAPGNLRARAIKTGFPASPVTIAGYQPLRTPENPSGATSGLHYSYYEGAWTSLPAFSIVQPVKTGSVLNFDVSVAGRSDNFCLRYSGFVNVPKDTIYTFSLKSDDGSKLYIGNALLINSDGEHNALGEQFGSIGLKAGKHALTVEYLQTSGGKDLKVLINGNPIASSDLYQGGTSSLFVPLQQKLPLGLRSNANIYSIRGQCIGNSEKLTDVRHHGKGIYFLIPNNNSMRNSKKIMMVR